MQFRLAMVSVLALSMTACVSGNALEALTAMRILEDNPSEGISYASRSGSGGNITLKNVELRSTMPAIVIGEAVAETATPTKPTAVAKAETLTFTGLDMKNGKPVFTGMVANGVTPAGPGVDPGMTMRIGSIGIEGMNAATGAYIAGALGKEGPGTTPPFAEWGFAKAAITDFTLASDIPGEASADGATGAPGSIKLGLGELSIANLKDTKIGLARIAGIKGDISVPGDFPIAGTFDLGALDLSGIQGRLFADAFEARAGAAADGKPTDMAKVFAGFTSPLEHGLDGARWSGMAADFSGLKFDASPATYTATRNADGVVVATSVPRATFKVTADASGGPLGGLTMMVMTMAGYPSSVLEVYSQGEASFDPKTDLTRYTSFNIGITDVVDIKVDGGLLGLQQALPTLLTGLTTLAEATGSQAEDAAESDEDKAEPDADPKDGAGPGELSAEAQNAMMGMVLGLIGLQVTDLDISITDKQLVKFILSQTASSSGHSIEAYRQDLVNMVLGSSVFLSDAGIDPLIAAEATTAISGFLREPGTLRIQLKPKAPVGAMTFMLSPPTKESLGFSATFTPSAPAN